MKNNTKKMIFAAVFAALICVMTAVIAIPNAIGGYVNLGEGFVILAGWLLGPVFGFLAAGIGAMFADIINSYIIFAPATFVIKGLTALTSYAVCSALHSRRGEKKGWMHVSRLISALAAECVMIAGYFVYSSILYGNIAGALASIPGDVIQAAAGIIIALLLREVIEKTGLLRVFPE